MRISNNGKFYVFIKYKEADLHLLHTLNLMSNQREPSPVKQDKLTE